MNIFLSHISQEKKAAIGIKDLLKDLTQNEAMVFLSSDYESMIAGGSWMDQLHLSINNSKLIIVLCSPDSINKPWVNFEVGAAWINKTPVLPICHNGMTTDVLTPPLSSYQGIDLSRDGFATKLCKSLSHYLNCSCEAPEGIDDKVLKLFSIDATERSIIITKGRATAEQVIDIIQESISKATFEKYGSIKAVQKQLENGEIEISLLENRDHADIMRVLRMIGSQADFK